MKTIKKLSRNQLRKVSGGIGLPLDPLDPGKWCCCTSSGCSTPVYGDSNDLTCVDKGTTLQKC